MQKGQPSGKKILIIKLGAMGDALRTTTVLPVLKKLYPKCRITWVSDKYSYRLLKFIGLINRPLVLNALTKACLLKEEFDLLLSLDEAKEAIKLAVSCKAKEKKGFALSGGGRLSVFNKASSYALRMTKDDVLKFKQNKKTYPEIIFEMIELPYQAQEYVLSVPLKRRFRADFLHRFAINKNGILVGIFAGCGRIYPTKKWSIEGFVELINMLSQEKMIQVVLLGGPEEVTINSRIKASINSRIIDSGCGHSLEEFINILDILDIIVAGDTLALHCGIALKKRTVGIFTSTSAGEIELYGRGQIIKADCKCSPCYKSKCPSMRCLRAIKPEKVFEAVKEQARFISKNNTPKWK